MPANAGKGSVLSDPPLEVKVWGDFACFTRPEMKVERVSYPAMTPSAARGILEAIFWKPEFEWQVREIGILKPISFFSILRNEVNSRASDRSAKSWEKSGGGFVASEDRAQRNSLALQNVAYIIRADIVLKPNAGANPAKYRDQFRRRVRKGQCYAQPYFGCREFTAFFGEVDDPDCPNEPEPLDMGLGRMLLDLDFQSGNSGKAVPRFFNAELRGGVLRVPLMNGASHAP